LDSRSPPCLRRAELRLRQRVGAVVYLSGVISTGPGGIITGTAGIDRTIEDYTLLRQPVRSQLAS